jgi:FkbM family methyltransferase
MSKTIIQIGSHVGNTINDPVFNIVDNNTKLILVEPVPYLFKQLKNNYSKKFENNGNNGNNGSNQNNGNIIFINKAVSNYIGEIEMTIPSEKNDFSKFPFWASQLSSVNSDHVSNHINKLITEKIYVETTTINEIVKEYDIQHIDLLHTDTEGHDYTILMNYNFKIKPKKIIFEHKHMDGFLRIGSKYYELSNKLISLGYKKIEQNDEDSIFELSNMSIDKDYKYTLCLNMIVKDEAHIIENTLTKLVNKVKIDYWVISDTGSTDNTKEIIVDFFKEKDIPGELFEDPWQDFGHNRTIALTHAYNKSDYLLIFDADDEIYGDFQLPNFELIYKDAYSLQFGDSNGVQYIRTQIINNRKKWKYVGVLHEYITCCEESTEPETIIGNYYTISGRTSQRNKDTNKYVKDAHILEKAYEEALKVKDEIYNRYGFYCANSYYDARDYNEALKWYKITLENKNWAQEKYVSCQRIYNIYKIKADIEKGIFYLVKAFAYDRERAECLYELLVYYCNQDMNDIAYNYYRMVKPFYDNIFLTENGERIMNSKLFLNVSKSDFFLPYYMIIIAYYANDIETGIQMYRIIFIKKYKEFNTYYIGNLISNVQFYIDKIKTTDKISFIKLFQEYIDFLLEHNYPIKTHQALLDKYKIYDS